MIDGGFWPENPSFAALPEPRPDADAIAAKWSGECVTGEHEPVTCNNKVIGARWYNQSGYGDPANGEFLSPRDRAGHGSHTASTAAGVPVDASAAGAPVGQVSGMAPAARLAIYKAVWHVAPGVGAGGTTDLLKTIDDAVADGVDVINFSIGDGYDEFDPTDVAFFNAAAAGVFVATAAGNSGPGAGTLDNAQAWVTTVAAGTHDVRYAKAVTLGKPSNVNYPSIAIGDFVGRQTVTRTVTDTTGRDSVYTVKVEAPPGITVKVSPTELTVPAGGSASFQVKVTAATPIMNRYAFGSLTWSDRAGHRVRSPIAVKPIMVRHPAAITGSGSAGSQALQVTPGYSGTLKAAPLGLTAPSVTTSRLVGTCTSSATGLSSVPPRAERSSISPARHPWA
ncbi:S8 family serine peptidase [Nonomuraea mesophila]|uniref:S8 family serine peptidase n=1 Tax=Nonomuraea mesophila TaxID=2530382 RepID=UPI00140B8309|nr:S8 family serine peptidase [Nonomuraea mesophila]